jgi:hypothetical protein
MVVIDEKHEALRLLHGIENGGLSPADAAVIAENIDHVLVYVIVSYLRAIHPASDPAANAVLERVVSLTSGSPIVVRKHKEGEQDPVSRWFEDEYDYADFRDRDAELIALIVDKLET